MAVIAIVVMVIIIIVLVVVLKHHSKEGLTNPNNDEYKKELALFKSLSPDKQIEYLNMSKEDKMAVYWRGGGLH